MANSTGESAAGPTHDHRHNSIPWLGALDWRDLLVIGAVIVLMTALSIYQLGVKSFWRDEVSSVVFASGSLSDLLTIIGRDRSEVGVPNMATYYLILHFWLALGETEARVRFLSVLFGVATTVPVFLVARRIGGTAAGALAALAFATSSVALSWNQEARGYSLAMLVTALLTLIVIHATERQRTWVWAAYGIVGALGLYVHFFVAFVLVAHGLWVVATRSWPRRWTALLAVGVPLFVAAAPLPVVAASLPRSVGWVPSLTLSGATVALRGLAGSDALLVSVLVLAGLAAYMRRHDPRIWLVLAVMLVPIAGAGIISLAKPVFLARYLVVSVPAMTILAGIGLASIRPKVLAVAAIAVVGVIVAIDLPSAYRDRHQQDWRAAVRVLERDAMPNDAIAFMPDPTTRRQINYYLERFDASEIPAETSIDRVLAGEDPSRLWVVALRPSAAGRDELKARLDGRYEAVMDKAFGARLRLILFERREETSAHGLLRSGGSQS